MGGCMVTREHVDTVKGYKERYPQMNQDDLAKLSGVSHNTVSRILRGHYDHLRQPSQEPLFGGTGERIVELLEEILDALKGDDEEVTA